MPEYICGSCGARALAPDTVLQFNASRPGVYERIMRLKPYVSPCGCCGAPVVTPFSSLYVDEKRRFAVRFTPDGFRVPLYAGPLEYTLRDTELIMDFREKILLFTHDLDDVVVETLKRRSMEANPETPFIDLLCMDVKEDRLIMRGLVEASEDISFNSPMELYRRLARTVPPDVHPVGFATVDQLWLDRIIHPENTYRIVDGQQLSR